eukprot:CAMPEP_0179009686 /NCGR_PEP_ID=MMETSP0795-20121207/16403_1 /TAXON_ID=88552 /ORGANISM="Amoebophrya sp., Strain Ameob2" /LENGTH=623 /DNA_ID=CAMNT_0020704897 /DNA_START=242 /DNA_END=2110 /DNA_ORIENTATION=-
MGERSLEMLLESWASCQPDGVRIDAAHLGYGYSYLETQLGEDFLSLDDFLTEMTPPPEKASSAAKSARSRSGSPKQGGKDHVGSSSSSSSSDDSTSSGDDPDAGATSPSQVVMLTGNSPASSSTGPVVNTGTGTATAGTATFPKLSFYLFWRGLGTVLLKSGHWNRERAPRERVTVSQSLFLELEILRERILHKYGVAQGMSVQNLRTEMDHAVGIASGPTRAFWLDCQQSVLDTLDSGSRIGEEELTILTLSWLNEAAGFARRICELDLDLQAGNNSKQQEQSTFFTEETRDPRAFERRTDPPGRGFQHSNISDADLQAGNLILHDVTRRVEPIIGGPPIVGGAPVGFNAATANKSTSVYSGIMRAVEQRNAERGHSALEEDQDDPARAQQYFYASEDSNSEHGSSVSGGRELSKKPPRVISERPRDGEDITGAVWEVPKPENGIFVFLHVYDVSQENSIKRLNRFTAHKRSPLKFGGIFHAGVEVSGLEWSYGATFSETASGIACNEPKQHPQHRYRQTLFLGVSSLTDVAIAELLGEAVEEWPGEDYDLLRRNCCHFADQFAVNLGVGGVPGWIYRFARIASTLDSMYSTLQNTFGTKKKSAEAGADGESDLGGGPNAAS